MTYSIDNLTNQVPDSLEDQEHVLKTLGSQLCKHEVDIARSIIDKLSVDYFIDLICKSKNSEIMTSCQYLLQTIINTLSGTEQVKQRRKEQAKIDRERTLTVGESISCPSNKKIDDRISKENDDILYNLVLRLIRRSCSYVISGQARDSILALVMTNIDYMGLNFGIRLVADSCITNLLDIASEVKDLEGPSSMEITPSTHSLLAAVLDRIYSCHDHDTVREIYREDVQNYLNNKLRNPDIDDKVRAAKIFTVLLSGPADVGNSAISQPGIIEMLLAMAQSDELPQQKAALDTIIATASKKDKCAALANLGGDILKKLKESQIEDIRLRALVGLSKISSMGSTDASVRPLSKEANPSFARDCRAIISRPTPEFKLKQYAIEALAYLSFDGQVKEELVDDRFALNTLFETLTLDTNSPVVYPILNIFVNITNSYDKQEHAPELIELAKFAQQHIPQEHPLDKAECVKNRIERLVVTDLVPSLVQLANVQSKAVKELISRIVNALCEVEDARGRIVQQGAVKILMTLAPTEARVPEKSCLLASHALARLGITINPEFVYPGQRLIAVIRPIKYLLKPDCSALQNFEGLLALTNIAQASEDARTHILHDNGFSIIEALMFEEHHMIRRAAVQCVVNLIREPQMVKLYEAENDRVKYLVILCQEDDLETIKAASGALAMLCQVSEKACERIFSAKQWCETLILLLSNENMELVHRAAVIVNCIVRCQNATLAERIFESKLFEVLLALTLPTVTSVPSPVKSLASSTLKVGKQRDLITDATNLQHIEEVDDEDD